MIDRLLESGQPRSAHFDDNIDAVKKLVLSQEGAPQTHRAVRQTSRETGIHRSSVLRIIHDDLQLKCFKKRRAQELIAGNLRLTRSRQLL